MAKYLKKWGKQMNSSLSQEAIYKAVSSDNNK
jgi:hypothetical protein